jgi:hypothetical protein
MTKGEAVIALMNEARSEKLSQNAAGRVMRACKTLGVEQPDLFTVLSWLDYCKPDGQPWPTPAYSLRIKPIEPIWLGKKKGTP